MGRGGKIGTVAAFSIKVGALVARRDPPSGWEGRGGSGTAIPREKGGKGGAWGFAHRGVGHDSGGGRSSGDMVAPHGELLHKWGGGGEGWPARETGAVHGGLPRWGSSGFELRRSERWGICTPHGHFDRHRPGWPMGYLWWPTCHRHPGPTRQWKRI
jgi:hypothetical protein